MTKRLARKIMVSLPYRGAHVYSGKQYQDAIRRIGRLGIGSGAWARVGRRIQRELAAQA